MFSVLSSLRVGTGCSRHPGMPQGWPASMVQVPPRHARLALTPWAEAGGDPSCRAKWRRPQHAGGQALSPPPVLRSCPHPEVTQPVSYRAAACPSPTSEWAPWGGRVRPLDCCVSSKAVSQAGARGRLAWPVNESLSIRNQTTLIYADVGFSSSTGVEEPPASKRLGFDPWVGKIPWRRAWQPIPGF